MIKEDVVEIKIVGRTVKKFNSLNYNCKVGDIKKVKIEDLSQNSHVKITAVCDNCNKEKVLPIYAYFKNYNNQKIYLCNDCKQIKIEKTNKKKYGVNRPIQNKKIREKLEKTCLKKYGFTVSSKNKEVIDKLIKTNLERFGETSSAKSINNKEKQRQTIIEKLLKKYKYLNIIKIEKDICTFLCDEGHNYELSFSNLHNRLKYNVNLCTKCNPLDTTSERENQLSLFLQNNYSEKIILNSRKIIPPYELDIYLPELNLAFEFNGIYWHSEIYKDKYYHYNKSKLCADKGIQLIHIWEDDWSYKQDIVKSMILNKLGKTSNKIYARKTEVRKINDNKLIKKFLNDNHIQGFVGSSIKIGLFYENELVSLMTFKKYNDDFDLNRMCTKLNTIVVGGASKLLKYFEKNYIYKNIKTFSNNSYSNGSVYFKLGFSEEYKIKPDYSFIQNNERKHKFNFRKNEKENIKIYDAGKVKFSKN